MSSQHNILLVLWGVVAILAIFSATYGYLLWRQPSSSLPKIGSRLQFLWVMTFTFALAYFVSPRILVLYLWFIAFLALKELFSMTPMRRADRRVLFFAYLSLPIQFTFILLGWYRAFIAFVPVHVFLVLPIIMVLIGETQGFLRAWSMMGWIILTTVLSVGYLAYLAILPPLESAPAGGLGLYLFLVGLAQLNHAAQYYFGRRFRNPKYSLKVSQTRNGASLVGSIVTTAPAAGLTAPLLTPFRWWEGIAAGVLISLGAFIGYIILSAIKSDLRLTDRGTMVPGRGGILNRIDTFVYTAPLFFYIVAHLYYRGVLF